MGLFQKDLPLSLCPLKDNPEGLKYQARLRGVDQKHILVYTRDQEKLPEGLELRVEFHVDANNFAFETAVDAHAQGGAILLGKPSVVHKSRFREGNRVDFSMPIHYTLWTETGRFDANLLDMSESGVRMKGRKSLRKGELLSLDFYIKDAKIRVICQGLVAWCRQDTENEYLYETGVEFTTLSNDTRKKLGKFTRQLVESRSTLRPD